MSLSLDCALPLHFFLCVSIALFYRLALILIFYISVLRPTAFPNKYNCIICWKFHSNLSCCQWWGGKRMAIMCNRETAKCHTCGATHTQTHTAGASCPFWHCVRASLDSVGATRFELSRPHMSAWGQSNYRWCSRWWWIQANTHCNILMSWLSVSMTVSVACAGWWWWLCRYFFFFSGS